MAHIKEGQLIGSGSKFGIVVARFNEFICSKLLGGAYDALHRHGVSDDDITTAWVPGSFEIPLIAQKMAESANTTPLSASAQSSAARRATTTWSAMKQPRALLRRP